MGDFGKNLKNIRMGLGLTQQELADKLGVTRPTISGYETKGKEPDYETLVKIADMLHVTTDDLLRKTEPGSIEKTENKKTEIPDEFKKSNIPDIEDMVRMWEKTMLAYQKLIVYVFGSAGQEKFDKYMNKLVEVAMRARKQAEYVTTMGLVGKADFFEDIENFYEQAKKDYGEKETKVKNCIKRELDGNSYEWEDYQCMEDWLCSIKETEMELFNLNIAADKISYLKSLLVSAKSYGYESESTLE